MNLRTRAFSVREKRDARSKLYLMLAYFAQKPTDSL